MRLFYSSRFPSRSSQEGLTCVREGFRRQGGSTPKHRPGKARHLVLLSPSSWVSRLTRTVAFVEQYLGLSKAPPPDGRILYVLTQTLSLSQPSSTHLAFRALSIVLEFIDNGPSSLLIPPTRFSRSRERGTLRTTPSHVGTQAT